MGEQKAVFISHSTKDRALAEILVDTIRKLGVAKGAIFCSSYRGADVNQQISKEIKEAITSSRLDIIILSNDYKQSAYCLNEAGVIWYKNWNFTLIISLPDIFGDPTAGFITTDYKQYHMDDADFCNNFVTTLYQYLHKLGVISAIADIRALEYFKRQIEEYMCHLPIIKNASFGNELKQADIQDSVQKAQWNIREMFSDSYMQQHQIPVVFYEHYTRNIELNAIEPGKMKVTTITNCRLVNLSDRPYVETLSSQFLRDYGGAEEYSGTFWRDGNEIAPEFFTVESKNCVYVTKVGPTITVAAHKSSDIEYTTTYQIAPERFFQSKLIKIPCGDYRLYAAFGQNFKEIMQQDYIFRFQVIPCVPRDFRNTVIPDSEYAELENKHVVSYSVKDGFPAGGGYAIVINKK